MSSRDKIISNICHTSKCKQTPFAHQFSRKGRQSRQSVNHGLYNVRFFESIDDGCCLNYTSRILPNFRWPFLEVWANSDPVKRKTWHYSHSRQKNGKPYLDVMVFPLHDSNRNVPRLSLLPKPISLCFTVTDWKKFRSPIHDD